MADSEPFEDEAPAPRPSAEAGAEGPTYDLASLTGPVRDEALPLTGPESWDPLLRMVGDARYVLLGEASHGTADFHQRRAEITRRLIEEKGFSFVAVEGDWPDCAAVHRAVTAAPGEPEDPARVLERFDRWPAWMWANTETAAFTRRLRAHNAATRRSPHTGLPVGFFGLDVYSLWESLHAVLDHLGEHAPDRLVPALEAYRCFQPYARDPESRAAASRFVPADCAREVLELLRGLPDRAGTAPGGGADEFAARQNAEVVAGAERYYRALVGGGPEAWNVRETHMADTLDRLMEHHGPSARAVVWAHNTHVGDARATDTAAVGMVSLGRLVRERHEAEGVVLVGFGSYDGTVLAADRWGGPPREMRMPPAREGSVEHLLHEALPDADSLFLFPPGHRSGRPLTHSGEPQPDWVQETRGQRAIGVVYEPEREQWGNYTPTVPGERYDAYVHLDRTRALTPLATAPPLPGEEETWPSGQ